MHLGRADLCPFLKQSDPRVSATSEFLVVFLIHFCTSWMEYIMMEQPLNNFGRNVMITFTTILFALGKITSFLDAH